jgi:CheY-like chemotaxis protein
MFPRSRILIVHDNDADVRTWKEHLSDLDCDIDVATDGADTLERVARFQPDLILLNPLIGKGGGFDVCRQIKEDPTTRKTMILMVTPLFEPGDVERAVEAGTDDFLGIPVVKLELVKRVENMLRLRRLL